MGKEALINDLVKSQEEALYKENEEHIAVYLAGYSAELSKPDILNKYIEILERPGKDKNHVGEVVFFEITKIIMANELEEVGYIEFLKNKWYHWIAGRITRYTLTEKGTRFLDSLRAQ